MTRLTGGANNTGDIRLRPNTNDPNELRSYLIAEVTESFMQGQGKGWGFLPGVNNEESCGEGLSLFLTQQFELSQGIATRYTNATANGWLNSSLPASNPKSTRFVTNPDGSVTDFGSRFDYVNSTLPYPGNGPGWPGWPAAGAFVEGVFRWAYSAMVAQPIALKWTSNGWNASRAEKYTLPSSHGWMGCVLLPGRGLTHHCIAS